MNHKFTAKDIPCATCRLHYEGTCFRSLNDGAAWFGEKCEHYIKGEATVLKCAECGKEILNGNDYLEVADNYLQMNYFDSREDAIFCCENCLMDALSVEFKTR